VARRLGRRHAIPDDAHALQPSCLGHELTETWYSAPLPHATTICWNPPWTVDQQLPSCFQGTIIINERITCIRSCGGTCSPQCVALGAPGHAQHRIPYPKDLAPDEVNEGMSCFELPNRGPIYLP
jgi:hypothetical protein